MTTLHIDSSLRTEGSVSRQLAGQIADKAGEAIIYRDLSTGLPGQDAAWLEANFTPPAERSDAQKDILAGSDALIEELKAADTIVIGVPLYNFSIPAALKAWIDLICRAGLTFKYTENGPVGLLEGKRAVIVLATGGVPLGAAADFASGYMRHVLGFIGITQVDVIAADQLVKRGESAIEKAQAEIEALSF